MNYLNFDLYNLRAARAWAIPAVGDVIRVRERGIRQCVTESRRVKTSLSSAPESGLLEVSTRLSLYRKIKCGLGPYGKKLGAKLS